LIDQANFSTNMGELQMMGAGHDDYCKIRISREGLARKDLEKVHRNVVYFARQYVTDWQSGHVSKGHVKIGKSNLFNSLQRGRNQSGGDFRIKAELCFANSQDAEKAEQFAHYLFMNLQVKGPQNQTELFVMKDEEILPRAKELIDFCVTSNDRPLQLLESLLFTGGQSVEEIVG
jgi:hypothetical protein